MDDTPIRGSRASLTVQWRNAVALLVAAIFLGGLDVVLVTGIATHTFVLGRPGVLGDWVLLLLVTAGVAAGFAGYSASLFRQVTRGEAELRRRGDRWRIDRSLIGATRLWVVTDATPEVSLRLARALLSDRKLGLTHVGRGVTGGVRAIRPAETGPLVVSVMPLAVRIRARERRGRTVLTVSAVPSSVYGWPLLSGWVGWSASYTWVGVGQELVEYLATALVQRLKGTVE